MDRYVFVLTEMDHYSLFRDALTQAEAHLAEHQLLYHSRLRKYDFITEKNSGTIVHRFEFSVER